MDVLKRFREAVFHATCSALLLCCASAFALLAWMDKPPLPISETWADVALVCVIEAVLWIAAAGTAFLALGVIAPEAWKAATKGGA